MTPPSGSCATCWPTGRCRPARVRDAAKGMGISERELAGAVWKMCWLELGAWVRRHEPGGAEEEARDYLRTMLADQGP